jgi:hypothetical protein
MTRNTPMKENIKIAHLTSFEGNFDDHAKHLGFCHSGTLKLA